ncbi:MAG TPA: alpha/beta fold hydrolase [Acidimicrobiales bacterium]
MPLHAFTLGAGPRVVLVHGFTQSGATWGSIADDLATDHEVVLVDLPGHGGSADVRADLVEAAVLVGEAGGRAVYVGYSLGARVSLHLALTRPQLVRGLLLQSGTAGIVDAAERAARRMNDTALAEEIERDGVELFLERWLAQPMFVTLPPDAAALAERRTNTAAGLAASLRLMGTGTQEPLWGRLGELTMPVTVRWGGEDHKFAELGRRMARAIRAAEHEEVPGHGHAAHLEDPASFVASVRRLVARTAA